MTRKEAIKMVESYFGAPSDKARSIVRELWAEDQVNFVTPYILGYWEVAEGVALEMSAGSGLNTGYEVFGLTFVQDRRGDKPFCRNDLSSLVDSTDKMKEVLATAVEAAATVQS